jgi:hypothetical protein
MNLLNLWNRLKGQPRSLEADLDEELAFHQSMRERDLEQNGVSTEHARAAARRSLGNLTAAREHAREAWRFTWFTDLVADLRYAARSLGNNPGFAIVAMATLSPTLSDGDGAEAGDSEATEESEDKSPKSGKLPGFTLEYDAARKIAQGLGAHLELLVNLVEVKGETARLLPVAERTKALFGKEGSESPAAKRKKSAQLSLPGLLEELEGEEGGWTLQNAAKPGDTTLDRLHQAMILFAAGRGEALRRFLVDEGAGKDQRFWRLAQSLCALYPSGTDERHWAEGVLARKKGLGL